MRGTFRIRRGIEVTAWDDGKFHVLSDEVTRQHFQLNSDSAALATFLMEAPRSFREIELRFPGLAASEIREFLSTLTDRMLMEPGHGLPGPASDGAEEKRRLNEIAELAEKLEMRGARERRGDSLSRNVVNAVIERVRAGEIEAALVLAQRQLESTELDVFRTIAGILRKHSERPNPERIIAKLENAGIHVSRDADRRTDPFQSQLYEYGLQSMRKGRMEDALDAFARLTRLYPENARATQVYEQLLRGLLPYREANRLLRVRWPWPRAAELFPGLLRWLEPFVHPAGLAMMAGLASALCFLHLPTWISILPASGSLFGSGLGWLAFAMVYAFGAAFLHECAHALSCLRQGGKVPEAGFMLLFLAPSFYVDVSSSWSFPHRTQRLQTLLAGPIVDLFLFGNALALLHLSYDSEPFVARASLTASLVSGGMLLGNLNPFIRFDGYYILSELLGVANLKTRSLRLRENWSDRSLSRVVSLGLFAYGVLSLVYVYTILAGFFALAGLLAHRTFGRIGLHLLLVGAATWLAVHAAKSFYERRRKLARTARLVAEPVKAWIATARGKARPAPESAGPALPPPFFRHVGDVSPASRQYKEGLFLEAQNAGTQRRYPFSLLAGEIALYAWDSRECRSRIELTSEVKSAAMRFFRRPFRSLSPRQKELLRMALRLGQELEGRKVQILVNNRIQWQTQSEAGMGFSFIDSFKPIAIGDYRRLYGSYALLPRSPIPSQNVPVMALDIESGTIRAMVFESGAEAERCVAQLRGVSVSGDRMAALEAAQKRIRADLAEAGRVNVAALCQWRSLEPRTAEERELALIDGAQWPALYREWERTIGANALVELGFLTCHPDGALKPFFQGTALLIPIPIPGHPLICWRYRILEPGATVNLDLQLLAGRAFPRFNKYGNVDPAFWLKNAPMDAGAAVYPPVERCDELLLVEGELKALVARQHLPHAIHSIAGIGKPSPGYLLPRVLESGARRVLLVMDRDEGTHYVEPRLDGIADVDRLTFVMGSELAELLKPHGIEVRIVRLPLEGKKSDLESFCLLHREASARELAPYLENAMAPSEFALGIGLDAERTLNARAEFLERYQASLRPYGLDFDEPSTGLRDEAA